jgi:hypothetical protein
MSRSESFHNGHSESDVIQWRKSTGHDHESSLKHALTNWSTFGEIPGDDVQAASQKLAMKQELDVNSRPNPVPLYRGSNAGLHPTSEIVNRSQIMTGNAVPGLSFSEKRSIANKHASLFGKEKGSVSVAKPGTVKGINLRDYDIKPHEEHEHDYSNEHEWLVHPDSVMFWHDRRNK